MGLLVTGIPGGPAVRRRRVTAARTSHHLYFIAQLARCLILYSRSTCYKPATHHSSLITHHTRHRSHPAIHHSLLTTHHCPLLNLQPVSSLQPTLPSLTRLHRCMARRSTPEASAAAFGCLAETHPASMAASISPETCLSLELRPSTPTAR